MNKLLKEANQMLKFWCLDAEPTKSQRVKFESKEGGEKGHQAAIKKEEELKRKHKEVKLVMASPFYTYFEWEVKDASPEEVARKREIERLSAFIKKYPTGSNNRLVANAIEEAKVKLAELINGKKISQDNDATENGAIKQFGQSKETEVMPLEKKPVLAQDDKFGTVMKEFYEGKLKSGSGETVTDPQQAKAIAYSESEDEEPVYTLGGQFKKLDELEKEKLEVEGKLQELYDIRDGLLSGAKNTNSSKFNPIKQNIQNHENKLKEIEKDINKIKSGGKMTKDDFYTGEDDTMTTKEAREYWNKYHNTDPVLELYDTFEEWYRESKRNGYIKDEATTMDANIYSGMSKGEMGAQLSSMESLISDLKEDLRSGEYDGTVPGLKSAEDVKSLIRKTEKNIEELKRIATKTTHDECMEILKLSGFATDAEPTWQDVYKYFTNASLQELERLDSKDKVISFLRQKGAYGKFPQDKIEEAIRRFMDS